MKLSMKRENDLSDGQHPGLVFLAESKIILFKDSKWNRQHVKKFQNLSLSQKKSKTTQQRSFITEKKNNTTI